MIFDDERVKARTRHFRCNELVETLALHYDTNISFTTSGNSSVRYTSLKSRGVRQPIHRLYKLQKGMHRAQVHVAPAFSEPSATIKQTPPREVIIFVFAI